MPVLQTQVHEKIASPLPVKETLLKAVLELLEGLRSKTCMASSRVSGGYQVSWASCAQGDMWGSGTHSMEVLGVTEAAWLVLPWSALLQNSLAQVIFLLLASQKGFQ